MTKEYLQVLYMDLLLLELEAELEAVEGESND